MPDLQIFQEYILRLSTISVCLSAEGYSFDFAFPFTSTNDWFYRNHHTFLPKYLMFSGIVSSAHP